MLGIPLNFGPAAAALGLDRDAVSHVQNSSARPEVASPTTNSSGCDTPGSSTLCIGKDVEGHGPYRPLAVVGMAMRLPGGVKSEQELWDMLVEKRDGLCRVPESRYTVDSFYSESKPHSVKTTKGYFLQDDPAEFDAGFFGISNYEAARLDPQQRLLLEVVWECMENAGQGDWQGQGKDIGCYVGVFGEDWLDLSSKDTQQIDRVHVLGTGNFALSNRISYEYDLTGPSMTFQTGCSSSLVGFHEACQALQAGDCSSAIVAGSNLILSPTMTTTMSDNMVLAPDGICKTFDRAANGYGRGEAVNAIFIKPLDKALSNGDPIRAIIRSTATNCDGKTPGITTPGSKTQKELILKAYQRAGITDLSETAFFECHGTGTTIGDQAETSVVADLFRASGIYIGAVKPNVGHSEGASGLTSIIKAVLSLEKNMILPNAHFKEPNPKIAFEEGKLEVPVELRPWPPAKKARISVNCFGIGGANAHVILDSAASYCPPAPTAKSSQPNRDTSLLLVSASAATALESRMTDLGKYVEEHLSELDDLAYTLAFRRKHLLHRGFFLVQGDGQHAIPRVTNRCLASSPSLTFVFNGQGSQWAGMAKELLQIFSSFRVDIKWFDKVLQTLNSPPEWSIEEELSKSEQDSRINDAEISQPLCTAIQIGIVNLLASWGVHPASVVGHSSGEICAAYSAGAITAETAIVVAYYRGQVAKGSRKGAMAAVGLGAQDIQPYLQQGVVVACHNSPVSCTISGDIEKVDAVLDMIRHDRPDTLCRRLRVETAYHSDHMRDVGGIYENAISRHVRTNDNMLPLMSTVSGEIINDPGSLNASYWRQNLESPVLFSDAIRSIVRQSQNQVFIEIGPHSVLAGPIRQLMQSEDNKTYVHVPTLLRNQNQANCMLASLGNLWSLGVPVDVSSVVSGGSVLTDLPAYPWDHGGRFWNESRLSQSWRLRPFPHHELLGSRVAGSSDREPVWRNLIRLEDVPWLSEHVLLKNVVFPGACYISMIGEAIYQQTGSEAYSIRNLLLKAPLFLVETHAVEVITTLKPLRLTDFQDSHWYEFTITAYDGKDWVKHCQGEASMTPEKQPASHTINPAIRKIKSGPWYRLLASRGLCYGPRFQGLQDITTNPNGNIATARVDDDLNSSESHYSLHPTVIDQCLQLMSVAAYSGLGQQGKKLAIPSHMDNIHIDKCVGPLSLEATVQRTSSSIISGNITGLSGNSVDFSLTGASCFTIDDQEDTSESRIPLLSRLKWMPDVELMRQEELLPFLPARRNGKLLRDMTALCIVESGLKAQELSPANKALKNYQTWLLRNLSEIRQGSHQLSREGQECIDLTSSQRCDGFDDRLKHEELQASEKVMGEMWRRVMRNTATIIEGKVSPLNILMEDGLLEQLYRLPSSYKPWEKAISHLMHSNPRMKILEIGAGTGGATGAVLKSLHTTEGVPMFASYTFTDLSSAFFGPAQEKLKEYGKVNYAVLDISKDPVEQGFEHATYDLIIAANVLHATPCIRTTLQHVRRLLLPGGRLLLQELDPALPSVDYVMGTLPGWWLGEGDGRAEKPYITAQAWGDELLRAGFSGVDALCFDDFDATRINANLLATNPSTPIVKGEVIFVSRNRGVGWEEDLSASFTEAGYVVRWTDFSTTPSAASSVVFLLDQESPFLQGMTDEEFDHLKSHLQEYKAVPMLWITQSTQTQCNNPWFGLILGMARSLRKELGVHLATVEIDQFNSATARTISRVFEKFSAQIKSTQYPDLEYIIQDGAAQIGRFEWESLSKKLLAPPEHSIPKKLFVKSCGILDSMEWVPVHVALPQEDEVLVDLKYVALNFKDIMVSMGVFGFVDQLGIEGTGVVRKVGRHIKHLQPGDAVALAASGAMQTQICLPASSCGKIPEFLSLQDAATMGVAFSTVLYCLVHLGRVEEGQSILIHSAAGGVGQAAIQVSQHYKLEIYVTVGNKEKALYLQDHYKISPDHIFNSRDTSFLPDLMNATQGRGVDIVLNSLAGELLHASWKCVAEGGMMFELGKRDFLGHGMLSMEPFIANRAFFGVDLDRVIKQQPLQIRRLSQEYFKLLEEKHIAPIHPVNVFDAANVIEAFRYMQKGVHMGKILVQFPESPSSLPAGTTQHHLQFKSEASYLLVGGLGGIGQAVSRWMFEHGARHLVFLSRSAGQSMEHQEILHELEALGCQVTVVTGNVSRVADIQRAIESSEKALAGVINLSMVLKDENYLKMTHEEWKIPFEAKVDGTWNLHNVLRNVKLDFFVVFSSICSLAGNIGQANYAAANTFLDAFVQYRHAQGLPASVLNLGCVDEIGTVARDPQLVHNARTTSMRMVKEAELLDALHLLISEPPASKAKSNSTKSHVLALGMSSTKPVNEFLAQPFWKAYDGRFLAYENLESSTESGQTEDADTLRSFIADIENNPDLLNKPETVQQVTREVGKLITSYVSAGQEMSEEEIANYAVDSLMSIEIRNWVRRKMMVDVSLPEISRAGTVAGLAILTVEKLKAKYMPADEGRASADNL